MRGYSPTTTPLLVTHILKTFSRDVAEDKRPGGGSDAGVSQEMGTEGFSPGSTLNESGWPGGYAIWPSA